MGESPTHRRAVRAVVFAICAATMLVSGTAARASVGATRVAAGFNFTCALLSDGSVDCWGDDRSGELGNGTTGSYSPIPVKVSGITDATAIAAGYGHACALLATGHVACWGQNADGELGNGTTTSTATATPVTGISNATAVSAGGENTCAVLSTHHVECWGDNGFGQLGNGRAQSTDPGSAVPTPVKGIANATAISAGGYDTCARLSTGHVDCWGSNGSGALGAGLPPSLITHAATPVAVSKITNATGVSAANWEACAVLSTGAIKCWGWNIAGELGNGTQKDSPAPVPVTGIANATGVAAAVLQTCAALQTGAVMCWGDEQGGVLGPDAPNGPCQSAYGYCTTTPIPVPPIVNATSVTATIIHTCAALQTGGVDCWGENLGGDLGDGTTAGTSTPTAVVGLPF